MERASSGAHESDPLNSSGTVVFHCVLLSQPFDAVNFVVTHSFSELVHDSWDQVRAGPTNRDNDAARLGRLCSPLDRSMQPAFW
jgi:hypothetical protein